MRIAGIIKNMDAEKYYEEAPAITQQELLAGYAEKLLGSVLSWDGFYKYVDKQINEAING